MHFRYTSNKILIRLVIAEWRKAAQLSYIHMIYNIHAYSKTVVKPEQYLNRTLYLTGGQSLYESQIVFFPIYDYDQD